MLFLNKVKIRSYEKGLLFRDGEFKQLLNEGTYWLFDPYLKNEVQVISMKNTWFEHENLDLIVKSGALENSALVLDLKDNQRALIWIEGRFAKVLKPGLYVLWKDLVEIRVEQVDISSVRFDHKDMNQIVKSDKVEECVTLVNVEEGYRGVIFLDGKYLETVGPGRYLFWKDTGRLRFYHVDMRERVLDITGQDIMTADKVTLRINALLTYQVVDALTSVSATEDVKQALYREAQLAIRSVVGAFELDNLITQKEQVLDELEQAIRPQAGSFGLDIKALGIRDIILPGEMKTLLNRVIEAQKAADANLIMRREETAAMRSQANTAKLLDSNPTLMRLRELDVLEKIADKAKLNVVLGEKGLADRIINLL